MIQVSALRARISPATGLALLVCLIAVPVSIAMGAPTASVDTSTTYTTDESGMPVTVTTDEIGETADGTVTRQASDLGGCCSMTAVASATTSSTTQPSWQWAAARSRSEVDVLNGPYPGEGTFINDSYDAGSTARYVIPWRIESTIHPDGTPVPVDVRTVVDGILSFRFATRDIWNWQIWEPGDPITPENWEGTLTHATVGVSIRVDVTRVSTGARENALELSATLDTVDGLAVDRLAYLTYFSDTSRKGELGTFYPAYFEYVADINHLRTAAQFEEFLFYVGEVYELDLVLTTTASMGRQYTWYTTWGGFFTLTSDFYETASYNLESSDPSVSFVALDSSSPDPGDTDSDGDGVPDDQDVCPGGDDNVNSDGDLAPDFCDACPFDPDNDADGDGVCGDVDVCPGGDDALNADGDTLPDFCDACPLDPDNDIDGDGICGDADVCPLVSDPAQIDTDFDLVGDACDVDDDNDGVCDEGLAVEPVCVAGPDNCPLAINPDQNDFDSDGFGDVCDADVDNDGVADGEDECPFTGANQIVGVDGCSVGDRCPCLNDWKNHGAYVRCIAHTAEDFLAGGLISSDEKDIIVSSAAQSSCGAKK